MEKMEIKLKECCLTCEHFCLDTSSIGYYGVCGSDERKIACVHMLVCQTYNGHKPIEVFTCDQRKVNRGYFGIGIYNGKTTANIGTLWRSANILGPSRKSYQRKYS